MSLSLTTGTLAVAMLLAGLLSDAVGRRPLMIVALLASAMLSLSTALVDDWTTLLVLRTLLGLALSGVPAVAMTYLVEEMDSRALGHRRGLDHCHRQHRAAVAAAAAVAPLPSPP
jgi:YNFM family putative membrane transporter